MSPEPAAKGSAGSPRKKTGGTGAPGSAKNAAKGTTAAPTKQAVPTKRAASYRSDAGGEPASRRALRNQGKRTMRKLLDAAMVAFETRGFHATRVNDVVEIAKTSHGTFYLYFSNKEDLLRALIGEASSEVADLYRSLNAVTPAETTWENLREWIGKFSAMWRHYAPLLRAWTDLASVDTEQRRQARQVVKALSTSIGERVAAIRGDSDLDPSAAGMAVIAMLDRFHFLREFVGEPIDDAALDTLTSLIYGAFFAPVPADS